MPCPQQILPEEGFSARCGLFRALAASVLALAAVAAPVGRAVAGIPPDQVSVDLPVYELSSALRVIEESWHYKVGWGAIPVGWATISGEDRSRGEVANQGVAVKASTNAFIDLLWRYRLDGHGELHVGPFGPSCFHIGESERRKQTLTRIEFDGQRRVHTFRRKGEKVTEYEFDGSNTYDVLATTWLFLNLDYEIGQTYQTDTVTGTSRYLVTVVAEGNEEITVCGQRVPTFRLRARTVETTDPGENKKHRQTELWVSTSRPRRLLKARAKTLWGSITLEMVEIKDLSSAPEPAGLCAREAAVAVKAERQPGIRRPFGPRRFLP